jgi:predicted O-methyltransferase YrrM
MSEPEVFDVEQFRKFTPKREGILAELEKEAKEKDIPIVGPYVGNILGFFVRLINAKRVLELGTATGYSAIWIAEVLSETGGDLVTVEWNKDMAEAARENIQEAGLSCPIKVISGDAMDVLSNFEADHFDMIFQDVDKEKYLELLEPCARVLKEGGLIVFDNTAFKTAGDFLKQSLEHPQLSGFHLWAFLPEHGPEYDGLTFLMKKLPPK